MRGYYIAYLLCIEALPLAAGPQQQIQLTSYFEENRGQFADLVRYAARTEQGVLFLEAGGHTVMAGPSVIRYRLLGASSGAAIQGIDRLSATGNYYIGNDSSRWRSSVPLFERVEYADIYPGIRMVHYRGPDGHLEHDFVVSPGSDPSRIRFRIDAASLTLSPEGDLLAGPVTYRKPVAYQETGGERRTVEAAYLLGQDAITFHLGAYDESLPLIIDPVVSLPVSHGGSDEDWAFGIQVDGENNVYVAGITKSSDFPVQEGATSSPNRGGYDVYLMKLAPNMRTILWTAFLGGSMDDLFQDLELDASGVPVIAGHTTSPDFPTKSALQASRAGVRDAFVAKIAPADGSLIFSTYFGFNGADVINGVKMDAAGNIVAVGLTNSTNFPTNPGAVSPTIAGVDCFIARLSSDASRLVNATLFGGTQFDLCGNLEINAAGEIIVMGTTRLLAAGMTNNFPTTANAFQRTYGGGETDAFVARFNASLTQLLYSTFLGGSGDIDEPAFLTLDSAGNAVLGGRTNSPNFPLTADARTRTFRLPFTGWTARINTGAATGPRAAIIEASSESPSVDPPKTNSVRFTRTGKRITDTKFFDLLFVIVEVVQFENLDGSAYSETNFYAPEDYYGDGPPFSTVPQDFLGYILGCSKACMDGSTSNSPNSAAKQRVAIEFLI